MRFESGRVQSIEVGSEMFTGREIREIFSLNSTNFTAKEDDDNIMFSTIVITSYSIHYTKLYDIDVFAHKAHCG